MIFCNSLTLYWDGTETGTSIHRTETKFYETIVTLTTSGTVFYFTVNAEKTPQKLFVNNGIIL